MWISKINHVKGKIYRRYWSENKNGRYQAKYSCCIEIRFLCSSQNPAQQGSLSATSCNIRILIFHQVDPLVSLMMVEKVPDSTYEMIGGLEKQIKEIKEVIELPVKHPELFEALGIAQPKVIINLLLLISNTNLGCSFIWSTWNRKNFVSQSSRPSYWLYFYQSIWVWISSKIHWRR